MAEPENTDALFDGPRRGPLAWCEDRALGAVLAVTSRAPWLLVDAALGLLARVAYLVDRRRNRAARTFLETALGPNLDPVRRERMVRGAYHHFFRVVAEAERFVRRVPRERTEAHVEVLLCDRARELRDRKTAVVLAGAHIGNWEVGTLVAERIGFSPFAGVAKPAKNHYVSRRILLSRRARGIDILPRRGAMAEAPQRIRAGTSLGLLLDQRARVKPVIAPLFGRPARCDRSAGVLIRRLGVPLALVACYRGPEPLTFEFHIDEVVEPEELASMNPTAIAARLNRSFERMILARPEQYFWLHDRFRDTPENGTDEPEVGDLAANA